LQGLESPRRVPMTSAVRSSALGPSTIAVEDHRHVARQVLRRKFGLEPTLIEAIKKVAHGLRLLLT
ncbi:MAG: hypothetical protein RLZZ626_1125, partial [Actinomycetota bacterium]